jgi:hypothetical protein
MPPLAICPRVELFAVVTVDSGVMECNPLGGVTVDPTVTDCGDEGCPADPCSDELSRPGKLSPGGPEPKGLPAKEPWVAASEVTGSAPSPCPVVCDSELDDVVPSPLW